MLADPARVTGGKQGDLVFGNMSDKYTEDTKDTKSRSCMECRSKPRWLDMVLMNGTATTLCTLWLLGKRAVHDSYNPALLSYNQRIISDQIIIISCYILDWYLIKYLYHRFGVTTLSPKSSWDTVLWGPIADANDCNDHKIGAKG